MPLYKVTVESIAKTWKTTRVEAPDEETAESIADADYDRPNHLRLTRLTWVVTGEHFDYDTTVTRLPDDAPADAAYVSWDEQYGGGGTPSDDDTDDDHPFKWLSYYGLSYYGQPVKIDTEIVPLIERLWAMRFETKNSCADNFGYIWIEFANVAAAQCFLTITALKALGNGDEELHSRARSPVPIQPQDRERLVTKYHTSDDSWLIAANTNCPDEDEELTISISIRFPREHLARVMAALTPK